MYCENNQCQFHEEHNAILVICYSPKVVIVNGQYSEGVFTLGGVS